MMLQNVDKKQNWLLTPDFNRLTASQKLAEEYDAAFEYIDFTVPDIYCDKNEVKHRINIYKGLSRDRSRDTLHGVFYDIAVASLDKNIRDYCKMRVEESVSYADELGLRGVVFHTGLIAELKLDYYIEGWLLAEEELMRALCEKYPHINIYIENTFEKSPEVFLKLKEKMSDVKNFSLCLDYAHAVLTGTPIEEWVKTFSPYIGHMHLNDNDLKSDLHNAPGDGKIDFKEYYRLIEKYNVNVPVLLELNGIEKQKRALEFMIKLKAEVKYESSRA